MKVIKTSNEIKHIHTKNLLFFFSFFFFKINLIFVKGLQSWKECDLHEQKGRLLSAVNREQSKNLKMMM